jgi:hypothetical protein
MGNPQAASRSGACLTPRVSLALSVRPIPATLPLTSLIGLGLGLLLPGTS